MEKVDSLLSQGYICKLFYGSSEPDLLHGIQTIRFDVWNHDLPATGQLFPEGVWREDVDEISYHWAVLDQEEHLVATARLTLCDGVADLLDPDWYSEMTLVPPGPIALLSRQVVEKSHRRYGLATFLLNDQIRYARELKANSVVLRAVGKRADYFKQAGFELVQAPKVGTPMSLVEFAAFVLHFEEPAQVSKASSVDLVEALHHPSMTGDEVSVPLQ